MCFLIQFSVVVFVPSFALSCFSWILLCSLSAFPRSWLRGLCERRCGLISGLGERVTPLQTE